ncbi:MAG: hypothetical protein HOW73_06425 [Polyangiaceae bacterium]|nr:hypothetical protein [Polyangiaceae bacterium]
MKERHASGKTGASQATSVSCSSAPAAAPPYNFLEHLYAKPKKLGRTMFLCITTNPTAGTVPVQIGSSPLACHRVTSNVSTMCTANAVNGCLEVSPGTGGLNAHYLPWSNSAVYRIALPAQNIAGPGGNLFFTANLSGCAILITGSPAAPVVYHANAEASANPDLADATDGHKIGWSEATMLTAISRFDLPDLAGSDPEIQTLRPSEYVYAQHDQVVLDGDLLKSRKSMATVFGVRKNGMWTFYYQKGFHLHTSNQITGETTDMLVVEEFGELWPTRKGP